MMSAKKAKELGCPSVAEVARWAGVKVDTMYRWSRSRPELFRAVCLGWVKDHEEYPYKGGDKDSREVGDRDLYTVDRE